MPSGKVHRRTSAILALPTGAAVAILAEDAILGVGATLGCLAGIVITPDADLAEAHLSLWQKTLAWLAWIVGGSLFVWWLKDAPTPQ